MGNDCPSMMKVLSGRLAMQRQAGDVRRGHVEVEIVARVWRPPGRVVVVLELVDGDPEALVVALGVGDEANARRVLESLRLVLQDERVGHFLAVGMPFVLGVRAGQKDGVDVFALEIQAIGFEVVAFALELLAHEDGGAALGIVLAAVADGRAY